MELSLSSKFLISSAHTKFPQTYSIKRRRNISAGTGFRFSPFIVQSKRSTYQDFQEFAKPSRLLPAKEVKASVENAPASFLSGGSESLYQVKIQTSKTSGSGLDDVNSGVLLCLIDENGTSILQRLPATSFGTYTWSKDKVIDDNLHFQRGAIDEFSFVGPNLGRIVAVWVGLESGQWRICGISLNIITHCQPYSSENNQETKHLSGLHYNFEFEDILLGEKPEASMMEFRPHSVTSFSGNELNAPAPPSLNTYITSNKESMKEYLQLKTSLLLYDSVLILVGSTFSYFFTGENASYAFLTGGIFGFLYLLLLQRSVDGISAEEFVPTERDGIFGRLNLKGPVSSLVLAFAFAIMTLKYGSGEDAVKLTPKDVVFGMMGFLMCKVSVVLAAFKPVSFSLEDNNE